MDTAADTKIAQPSNVLRVCAVAVVFIVLVWASFAGWGAGTVAAQAEATYENVVQVHQALAYYQADQAQFPSAYQYTNQEALNLLYIGAVPGPVDATGSCAKYPTFTYALVGSQDYSLTFCLSAAAAGLAPGLHTLSSGGVDVQASQ